MRKLALLATVSAMLALTGCSATLLGSDQVLMITTSDGVDAHCVLQNGSDAWTTDHTPAYVSIDRSHADMRVTCKSVNGEHGQSYTSAAIDAKAVVVGVLSGAALAASPFVLESTPFMLGAGQPYLLGVGHTAGDLAGMTAGGAGIALGHDARTGAMFKYDAVITVPMVMDANPADTSVNYVPMVGVVERPVSHARPHYRPRPVHHYVAPTCVCAAPASKPSGS